MVGSLGLYSPCVLLHVGCGFVHGLASFVSRGGSHTSLGHRQMVVGHISPTVQEWILAKRHLGKSTTLCEASARPTRKKCVESSVRRSGLHFQRQHLALGLLVVHGEIFFRKVSAMEIQMYPDELDWVYATLGRCGSFLEKFCGACLQADPQNYELLRPVVRELMRKYPQEVSHRSSIGRASVL